MRIPALLLLPLLAACAADPREGYAPVPRAAWPGPAAHPVLVLQPLWRAHPEGVEGRPGLDLSLRPEGAGLLAELTLSGMLDDSVEARGWRALLSPGRRGWSVEGLWERRRCRRGPGAGHWTGGACL